MKDKNDILWGMYQEHYLNARHHETLRANVTNFIIIVSGAIGTLIAAEGLNRTDLPLTVLLIFLGLFGAIFSTAHSERYLAHKTRATAFRDQLDTLLFSDSDNTLKKIKTDIEAQRHEDYPLLRFVVNAHWLWLLFPLIVALIGILLSIICSLDTGGSTIVTTLPPNGGMHPAALLNTQDNASQQPDLTRAGGNPSATSDGYKLLFGAIGTVIGALIGAITSYVVFAKGLRANTRNTFLDMIVSENAYRNHLDDYLRGIVKRNIQDVRDAFDEPTFYILLIRKPELKQKLKTAIAEAKPDFNKIEELTKKLFTA